MANYIIRSSLTLKHHPAVPDHLVHMIDAVMIRQILVARNIQQHDIGILAGLQCSHPIFPGYGGYSPLGVVQGTDLPPDYSGGRTTLFADGFESGDMSNWVVVQD